MLLVESRGAEVEPWHAAWQTAASPRRGGSASNCSKQIEGGRGEAGEAAWLEWPSHVLLYVELIPLCVDFSCIPFPLALFHSACNNNTYTVHLVHFSHNHPAPPPFYPFLLFSSSRPCPFISLSSRYSSPHSPFLLIMRIGCSDRHAVWVSESGINAAAHTHSCARRLMEVNDFYRCPCLWETTLHHFVCPEEQNNISCSRSFVALDSLTLSSGLTPFSRVKLWMCRSWCCSTATGTHCLATGTLHITPVLHTTLSDAWAFIWVLMGKTAVYWR